MAFNDYLTQQSRDLRAQAANTQVNTGKTVAGYLDSEQSAMGRAGVEVTHVEGEVEADMTLTIQS